MATRKVSTSTLVAEAIEDGVLVRPDQCEACGGGGRIMGHHDDYSKPLDVRWLCDVCHGKWHQKNEALHRELREISMTVAEKPVLCCPVCGHPTESVHGKVQKKYHRPCRDFKNFLEAAVRAVKDIDPKPTPEAAKKIKHKTFVALCRIGATVQPRDQFGQFC
jgi:hypothetical protein